MPTIRQESENDDCPFPDDDFTGDWTVEWPNGQVKLNTRYVNGNADGEYLCYGMNGNPAQRGFNQHGVCFGLWEDYWEDGQKFKETEYEDSGNFTERWLDEDGNVELIKVFRDGIEQ